VFALAHPDSEQSQWSRFWPDDVDFHHRESVTGQLAKGLRSIYAPEVARRLRELVRAFRPDVAHLHSIHHHLTTSVVMALAHAHVPIVWTLHDYRAVCPSTHLLLNGKPCERCSEARFYRALPLACKSSSFQRTVAAVAESYLSRASGVYAKVDRFIAPSRFLAATLLRMGFPSDAVEVLPNPIDTTQTDPAADVNGPDVLFVGRLSSEKGPDILMRACGGVDDVRLVLMGDGPMRGELRALSQSLGVKATFAGWTPRGDVRRAMRSAALLGFPSTCYENCPGVVLEAMDAGTPVIASDLGGTSELLDYGRCGELVPPADVPALTEAIRGLLGNRDRRARYAELGRRRLVARHDPDRHTQRLLDIYAAVRREHLVCRARGGALWTLR
jgi:glycosyltransferase involved in cell wall biosynthesis